MASVDIDKRSFIAVDANDSLYLTDLLCQTTPAGMASAVIYVE
jgi:hypothetical protein